MNDAHRQFAEQAIEFIHKLSYGEDFTYIVATSLAPYVDRLGEVDVLWLLHVNGISGSLLHKRILMSTCFFRFPKRIIQLESRISYIREVFL